MKISILRKYIREEVKKHLQQEYGSELLYYSAPGGFEQIKQSRPLRKQPFENFERWKVIALQLGARVINRGDDWKAEMPSGEVLGTFSKIVGYGTLSI